MSRAQRENKHITKWRGEIPISSVYTSGRGGQVFFTALKEKGELVGTHCGSCHQIYVPARTFCERCFAELTDEVKVGPAGTLRSFTVCEVDHENRRLDKPAAFALVQLDGATTLLLHRLLGVEHPSGGLIGSRVEAVIKPKPKRTGSILDIEGFRLTS